MRMLWAELAMECQLECLHCYAGSGPKKGFGTMTGDDWERVIREAASLGTQHVTFIGGEPTMSPQLPRLVNLALELGMTVEVYSNLVRVTPLLWELFSQPGVSLAASWYTSDREKHKIITGGHDTWRQTRANFQEAVRRGIPIRAGVVDGIVEGQDVEAAQEEMRTMGVTCDGADFLREFGRGTNPDPSQACGNCGDGRAAVLPDGTLSPCPLTRWMTAGSVHESALSDLMPVIAEESMAIPARKERAARRALQACSPDFCSPNQCVPSMGECNPQCSPAGSCIPQHAASELPACEPDVCGPGWKPCRPFTASAEHVGHDASACWPDAPCWPDTACNPGSTPCEPHRGAMTACTPDPCRPHGSCQPMAEVSACRPDPCAPTGGDEPCRPECNPTSGPCKPWSKAQVTAACRPVDGPCAPELLPCRPECGPSSIQASCEPIDPCPPQMLPCRPDGGNRQVTGDCFPDLGCNPETPCYPTCDPTHTCRPIHGEVSVQCEPTNCFPVAQPCSPESCKPSHAHTISSCYPDVAPCGPNSKPCVPTESCYPSPDGRHVLAEMCRPEMDCAPLCTPGACKPDIACPPETGIRGCDPGACSPLCHPSAGSCVPNHAELVAVGGTGRCDPTCRPGLGCDPLCTPNPPPCRPTTP